MKSNAEEHSDNELARIARNDQAAFGILYDRYVTRIYRYCHRRLESQNDAEDATSAIFTRACERIGSYRGGSFPAWLFAIARSVVIDALRAKKNVSLVMLAECAASAPDPALMQVDEDNAATIRVLIRSLTTEQQEVIELRLSGLNINEIAASLGKSVPATKMLQLRALKRLREDATESGLIGPWPNSV